MLEDFSRFRRSLTHYFTNGLKSLNIGLKQAALLRVLTKRGKASLAELSRDTLTDPAAMTRLVNDMLKNGFLLQKDHPTDKRRWELALTARGKKLAAEVQKIYLVLANESMKTLSPVEKNQFSATLQKLHQNLSDKKNSALTTAQKPSRSKA